MRSHRWLDLRWLTLALAAAATACSTMYPDDPGALVPRTVAEDPSLPAIDMNGSRFHVQAFGDPTKPVVVFMHGGPGGDYRSLLALAERDSGYSLADEYYLVYWDQRGTGLSRRVGKDELTLETYVADLDSLVARYSPGRPVYLVGESWGCMFLTRYINQYPQKVAGAVLIESGPLDGATMERVKDGIYPLDLTAEWLNDYAWSSQFLSENDHARMDYERMIGLQESQPKFHQRVDDPSPNWRLGAAANRYLTEDGQDAAGRFVYDFTTNLAAFTTPVLFITGSLSEVLGASLQRQQLLKYPSASLVDIDGAGHDVAWVKSAAVISQIRAYLAARTGGN